jgi:carbon-monoxide dehydrogenase medium subunit
MTTHAQVEASADVRRLTPALAEAAGAIGDRQVRARGTIGGSIAHADPGADLPGVLIALDATIILKSRAGERSVPADGFFLDLLESDVRRGEVLTEVRLPSAPRSVYEKWPNPASHYAIVGVAAVANGTVRIGVSGAAPAAFRATAAEAALSGGLTAAAIDAAAAAAYDGRDLLGDLHASDEYRGHLIEVLTRRALSRLR